MGRGTLDRLIEIVRKNIPDERDLETGAFMLHELPENSGTFAERIQKMLKLISSVKILWLQAIPQIQLDSEEALLKMLD